MSDTSIKFDVRGFVIVRLEEKRRTASTIHTTSCPAVTAGGSCTCGMKHQIRLEVDAMRRILDRHQPAADWSWRYSCPHPGKHAHLCTYCPREEACWPCPTVLDLAAAWEDHSDWREEWAA